MTAKQVHDAAAFIRGLAQQRGRNAEWAERAVREAVSLTAVEALQQHVIDVLAEDRDDLVQVARVGLVNAVIRFDVTAGSDFVSFAVPTIMGEVRRHFRDNSWSVKVPRRLKELHLRLGAATATDPVHHGELERHDHERVQREGEPDHLGRDARLTAGEGRQTGLELSVADERRDEGEQRQPANRRTAQDRQVPRRRP